MGVLKVAQHGLEEGQVWTQMPASASGGGRTRGEGGAADKAPMPRLPCSGQHDTVPLLPCRRTRACVTQRISCEDSSGRCTGLAISDTQLARQRCPWEEGDKCTRM